MSNRRDRAEQKRALKNAEKDLQTAKKSAIKAFDLKDPRFLGEAAVAATRGPAGLALFSANRGIKVLRERRAEQADLLDGLASDARKHAEAIKEHNSLVTGPVQKRRSPLRRFAPLWIVGLAGGAAVAGATAYFLRDQSTPAPAPAPTPAPPTPPAQDAVSGKDSDSSGEDLVVDTPDPEGPGDQKADTTPAATDSGTPGADRKPADGREDTPAPATTAGLAAAARGDAEKADIAKNDRNAAPGTDGRDAADDLVVDDPHPGGAADQGTAHPTAAPGAVTPTDPTEDTPR